MGPRSTDRGNVRNDECSFCMRIQLQWGRDRLIAEIWRRGRGTKWPDAASMGPRSTDRGNVVDPNVIVPPSALQWGRDRLIAEIPVVSARLGHSSVRFNGAAID